MTNDNQHDLFDKNYEPHFNGSDYVPARDWLRLNTQVGRVFNCISDGRWRTLDDIAQATGDPHASVSAQLRHLRKPRFGGHTIDKRHIAAGLFEYRLRAEQ